MPRRRSLLWIGLVLAVAITAAPSTASASEDDPFGGGTGAAGTARVQFTVSDSFVADFVAVEGAERPHPAHSGEGVAVAELPCALEGIVSSFARDDGSIEDIYGCVAYYQCGGERIDDLYTGVISASDARGAYASYLSDFAPTATGMGPTTGPDISIEVTADGLNTTLLEAGLAPTDQVLALPVFYYCRRGLGGPFEDSEPGFVPTFGWDADVETEYAIAARSDELIDELHDQLIASPPLPEMAPPIENGFTIVNLPTWFWIDSSQYPNGRIEINASSDRGTILLQGRATLDRVEWAVGDETIRCELDDMKQFEDHLHPFEDQPKCSAIFTTLDDWNFAYTAHFRVEQNVSRRNGASGPVAATTGWQPHPTQPNVSVSNDLGTFGVRAIYVVNTPINQVDE